MTTTQDWNEKELVENRIIAQLQKLDYTYIHGSSLEGERQTLRDVVLEQRLSDAIKRINPWIDDNNLHKVVRDVTHLEAASLMEANEAIHENIVHYVSVEQDLGHGKKNQTVKLIDFDNIDNNEFLVVNQFKVSGLTDNIIPDVVLFVNGLPLVVIECKSPFISSPIAQGVKQLERYQSEVDRLFYYNEILISTCGQQSKYGTVGAKLRHYGEWKDPYPFTASDIGTTEVNPQDVLVVGMLTKRNLLDLIQNFIVYEPEGGRTIKKLARYQQFRAVNKAIDRIVNADSLDERGGVVWHTQGSGKSLTMLYLAVKLRRLSELGNPTILVVTDRKDLDRQIASTFRRCGFPNPNRAESVADLRRLLRQGHGQTVMTTVQKFQEAESEGDKVLSTDANIFVMVDESHRTQYKGLATNMRTALPNACYLGFTGTPIDKKDKSTTRTFGTYIDTYTIQQSVDDGATVPILYESRMPDLQIEGRSLDALFDRIFANYDVDDRERIKQKYATAEAITAAPRRIEAICMDIIEHYEQHIAPNGFKAQIVAVNRETAILYKQTLDKLNAPESVVIISTGHNDKDEIKQFHLTEQQQRNYIERFKDPDDKLQFIIVCDMLLTGFDAPIEQVMYLDKPLREHNLLQAIARVNRTYDGKTYGLIVDYFGVSAFLKQALDVFHEKDIRGVMMPVESELPRLQSRHRAAMRFFDHVGHENLEACIKVLEPEDVRVEFDLAFKRFAESMDLVMPSPLANPYRDDLKFLGKVRLAAKQRYRDEEMDISDCGAKVKQLIEEHVRANAIEVLHDPIDILSSRFGEYVDSMSSDEAKASEMEHAIRHEIRVKMDENPVHYTSLREKLESLITEWKEHRLETVQLVLQLQELIRKDIQGYNAEQSTSGVVREQRPFYDLLRSELSSDSHDDEQLADLTQIVVEDVSALKNIRDWTTKEDVQREMRSRIKRQLRAAKCPSDKLEYIAQQVMNLAKVHFKA
ncbi:type I restriction endonuclease subunit R [Alicyclobacillus sp. TC]|uniref:Type I restriction enzyme endonuclease subunit n=1 Tax=Alicyclobacillus tolerans TaxID=90970 RepID=A0ABT9LZB7_9BACL|nr:MULTISPECIES: type I restriction endonuclease subunit R [Alicyclobacillus]MDP9729602.1 type I restriction enzyme R subunit [Alicyclobacillus tengchongensis]QRF23566.1 type I restriction endonuclease subunit R [Alicyclobacillus sp. TC]